MIAILNTTRSHYSAEEAAERTLTVSDLIAVLEQYFDGDEPIVFSNDNGYTYGYISENLIGDYE